MNIITFLQDETGAVTAEWVVITAAVIGLALATMAAFSTTMQNVSGTTTDTMQSGLIKTSFD